MEHEIIFAAHLEKTGNCPIEFEAFGALLFRQQCFRHRFGRGEKTHAGVVERIDQDDEAFRLIALLGAEMRIFSTKTTSNRLAIAR